MGPPVCDLGVTGAAQHRRSEWLRGLRHLLVLPTPEPGAQIGEYGLAAASDSVSEQGQGSDRGQG